MKISSAMVLCAGLGTRMRPLTLDRPKPMLKVKGKPLVDWALDHLANVGCEHAVVNLHYLGEQIQDHLKPRTSPQTTCIWEDPVLETGGGVRNAVRRNLLGNNPFYVCNADNLWLDNSPMALSRLADFWQDKTMDGLLLLQDLSTAHGYDGAGDFCFNGAGGRLQRRLTSPQSKPAFVFTGVQILHPRLFEKTDEGVFSLNVLYDKALAQGRLFGLVHTGDWFHVGTPDALANTNAVLKGRS